VKATFFEVGTTERGSELNKAIQEADLTGFARGSFKWCSVLADRIADALSSRPAADESAQPVYQFRYFGSGDWMDVSKEEYDRLSVDVLAEDMRFRTLYTHPAPVASKEAVPLSEATIQEIVRVRGRQDGSLYMFDALGISLLINDVARAILAQRDANKAEPKS
jgi:hypothetical protein